jgi:hypothetical protein
MAHEGKKCWKTKEEITWPKETSMEMEIHHDLIVMIPIINKGRNLHRFVDAK